MKKISVEDLQKILKGLFEEEKRRRRKVKNLRLELTELGITGKLSDPDRFAEILEELSILDPVDEEFVENLLKDAEKELGQI